MGKGSANNGSLEDKGLHINCTKSMEMKNRSISRKFKCSRTIKRTNILKSGGCLEFLPCVTVGTC